MKLKNKRILILMPFFFEYEKVIGDRLNELGATVFLINQDIFDINIIHHLLSTYSKALFDIDILNYYKKMTKRIENIDIVLVIKGSTLHEKSIEYLRNKYKCKFILYQWDSIIINPEADKIAESFDEVYTFDIKDSIERGWKYRPLFFDHRKVYKNMDKKYAISCICTLHSNRARNIKYLINFAQNNNMEYFCYLYINRLVYLRQRYLKKNSVFDVDYSMLQFKTLTSEEVNHIYNTSKCVFDYKSPFQTGLTMRSIEAIGNGCKLITNNEFIKSEKLYCKENVWIYNEKKMDIPLDFVCSPYKKLSDELYEYYSIDGWIKEIFSLT